MGGKETGYSMVPHQATQVLYCVYSSAQHESFSQGGELNMNHFIKGVSMNMNHFLKGVSKNTNHFLKGVSITHCNLKSIAL